VRSSASTDPAKGEFASSIASTVAAPALGILLLDLLRVVGDQAREDQDARDRDDEVHRAGREEHVHQAGQHEADQAHEQELAECAEIALGRVAVEAKRAERRRRDEEGASDRSAGVAEQQQRQADAHQCRDGPIDRLHAGDTHLRGTEAHEQEQAERSQDGNPTQDVQARDAARRDLEEQSRQLRRAEQREGHDAREGKARRHVVVYAHHVGAQADIECLVGRAGASEGVEILVSHLS
jgi:hypothetical protein